MDNKVIIYTGENCNHCKIVKNFMNTNNIKYEEKNIENEEYKEEIVSKGFMSIPVLVINDEYFAVNSSNFIGKLKSIM